VAILIAGLRNAVPYFVTGVVAMIFAFYVRYLYAQWISDHKELLALFTTIIIFAMYGIIFRRNMQDFIAALIGKVARDL
jgi:hypothetical protein